MIGPAMLALLLAAKPVPAPVMPTGPWIVRGEDNMCLLQRDYKVDNRTLSLVFEPLLDLDQMDVFVMANGQGSQYQGRFSASVARIPEPFTGSYFSVATKDKKRVTRLTAERRMLDTLKDGDALRVQAKPVDGNFAIVRPEKARVVLQTCIDGLKREWGIDPEMDSRAVSPVEGNPARYFGSETYPREALAKGIYGRVIALLNIDTNGAVEHCRIVSSAGKALNDGTCKATARIRFKPPLDRDGKPLPSTYVLPVRWVLPGSPDYP